MSRAQYEHDRQELINELVYKQDQLNIDDVEFAKVIRLPYDHFRLLKDCHGKGFTIDAIQDCFNNLEKYLMSDDKFISLEFFIMKYGYNPILLMRADELDVSIRSINAFLLDDIVYVGELVGRTEGKMLRIPSFGHKSLKEVKQALALLGLRFTQEKQESYVSSAYSLHSTYIKEPNRFPTDRKEIEELISRINPELINGC